MPMKPFAVAITLTFILAAAPSRATVTITDCATDAHCVASGRKTLIEVPDDTVVIAGAIVPLPGTTNVLVRAKSIAVDGASGGQISASGKGQSILLEAASVLVTGALHSTNPNGKILIRGVDMAQVQGPVEIDSGGDARVICTGLGCPLTLTGVHFRANHLVIDAQGDVIWDANNVDSIGPRDLIEIDSQNGSIRKSGAITVALSRGRLAAQIPVDTVDAVSEAVGFCEACQQIATPTPTATPHVATPTPTVVITASLPIGTPTPTDPGRTPTPGPTSTPGCRECNTTNGEVESTMFIRAAGDIDLTGDIYVIGESITVAAGGNVNLTNASLRNDFGKCGEIVVTAGGQVNVQQATLVDDNCREKPDVSELNGREELPHTGFNDVVGFPTVDD
jgi:hypothetical protein